MTLTSFSRFVLRTTDVQGASAFYDAILGRCADAILPLHEEALARGARPHWLGHIQVGHLGGVEKVAQRFGDLGAHRLGPPPGVADFVILRDPGGAIVALTESASESSAGVEWHHLSSLEAGRGASNYAELFGWTMREELDLGEVGRYRAFTFGPEGEAAGTIASIEGRPEIHPHWLFFFGVPELQVTIERVRTHGGSVLGPIALWGGEEIAVCEDPQGAAFGLIEVGAADRIGAELHPDTEPLR